MSVSRLELALEQGLVTLPEGRIVVFGAERPGDLAHLPPEQVCVVQRGKPAHDALVREGFDVCIEPPETAATAMVFLPRSKAEARATIEAARALSEGPVIVDGQKTDGIESIYRDLRKRAEVTPALSKAHGKLFAFTAEAPFPDWADPGELHPAPGFVTRVGVFSADAVDRGSAVLAKALPARLPKRVADLGAGWGYLSAAALRREGVEGIDLIEADHRALDCAKRNVTDPRARFYWADATTFQPEADYDAVIMNPPFHTGSAATPTLGTAFIEAAARMLRPSGQLWLVANRHLPYERTLAALFADLREIGDDPSFKLYHASRPRRRPG
ncbi:MAG: class I SAM-dependent methyltransferase [Pseudomonadota bacterium]